MCLLPMKASSMRLFKSNRLTTRDVEQQLDNLIDPLTGKGLISSGRIVDIIVSENGNVTFAMMADPARIEAEERLRYEAEQIVSEVKGVRDVRVILTAHVNSPAESQKAPVTTPAPLPKSRRVQKGANLSGDARAQMQPAKARPDAALELSGVRKIVAVASAKGGVGKSTIALNLAVALQKSGLRVGLLDADVYGPSVPTMTGTVNVSPEYGADKKLKPVEALGLKLMSIGYISDIDAPMIWRGPIVMSAISQMMKDVDWGELEILIIDTPPGTGDAQLTLAQRVALSGAVIVSTPQEVALADVRRGVAMFRKTEVPVLGIIENMAYFDDPVSQNRTYIFGEGGARRMAEALDVPFLNEIPLLPGIREGGDNGLPVATGDSAAASVFADLASRVIAGLADTVSKPAPQIVFE